MKNGLYVLAALDGTPLDGKELSLLGLSVPPHANGTTAARSPFAAQARDTGVHAHAGSEARHDGEHLVLLGHLDAPERLAADLRMPETALPAELALRALRKWGPESAMEHLPGAWSLARWNKHTRSVLAGVSPHIRDRMYFSQRGNRLAIAPHVRALASLGWVGRAYDPQGVPLTSARLFLREPFLGDRTALQNVTSVAPGTFRQFRPGGMASTFQCPPRPEPVAWNGSFEEAVSVLETILRKIVREALARSGDTVALMLSGGLDSSLLAWIAAEERRPEQQIFCLTSVAPKDGDIADERNQAKLVADSLGLPLELVDPGADSDPFRLCPASLAAAEKLCASDKDYVFERIFCAARSAGADTILGGFLGEMTVTRKEVLLSPQSWARHQLKRLRTTIHEWRKYPGWPDYGFNVRFRREILAGLPEEIRRRRRTWPRAMLRRADEPMGYDLACDHIRNMPTATIYPDLHYCRPFCDLRLIVKAAGMPVEYAAHNGMPRAIARAMMKTHLPESIRLRTDKKPFAPAHLRQMERHAGAAAARISEYRRTEAAEWLDLDWLEANLKRLADGRVNEIGMQNKILCTAQAAQIFHYWA